jgi:hypothetical protein
MITNIERFVQAVIMGPVDQMIPSVAAVINAAGAASGDAVFLDSSSSSALSSASLLLFVCHCDK